jgi:hypothetical protein
MNFITVVKRSANAIIPPPSVTSAAAATAAATAAGFPEQAASVAQAVAEIKEALGEMWLPTIYREHILRLRTRSAHLDFPAKVKNVEVLHTLLGVELKAGRRRMLCPDLATARYLAVFARADCPDIAVPYDITQISRLADELESSWHRMLLLIEKAAEKRSRAFGSRLRSLLLQEVRAEIREAGAGTPVPQFNQNTKQRRA